MSFGKFAVLASLLLAGLSVASAEVIVDLVDPFGNDSGWSAILADTVHNGIVVDAVTSTYVRIEIAKDFYLPPSGGAFPPNVIHFCQRLDDARTVATIQINDEIIANHTGAEWTDFHWQIVGGSAAFDRPATDASGFSVDPFTTRAWGPPQTGWDANHPVSLSVAGGVVPVGGVFTPGLDAGKLHVSVNLTGDPVRFSLIQNPTPEPGALALVALGGAIALARHRRMRTYMPR